MHEITKLAGKLNVYTQTIGRVNNSGRLKINDLIWDFPYSYTDRSNLVSLNEIEVGKIARIKVKVLKSNFIHHIKMFS